MANTEPLQIYPKKTGSILHLNGIDNYTREDLDDLKNLRLNNPAAILSICISTTSACNLRCWYCYALANKRFNPNQLKKEEYISLISEAVDLGAKTVIICGDGEPTNDVLLKAIISYGFNKGLTSVVVTNGTILGNEQLSQKIHKCSAKELVEFLYLNNASLIVKLETLKEESYNRIVQVEGSWHNFNKGVENILDAGFNKTWQNGNHIFTRLAFTGICTKENHEEVPVLKQYSAKLNAQFIFKVPSPTGGALIHANEKLFPFKEITNIKNYVNQYSDKHETLTPLIMDSEGHLTCMAWHLGPVISEEGNYVECYTSSGKSFGNIRESSLRDLLFKKEKDTNFSTPCPIKERLYKKLTEQNELTNSHIRRSTPQVLANKDFQPPTPEEFERYPFLPRRIYETSAVSRFNALTKHSNLSKQPEFLIHANHALASCIIKKVSGRPLLRLLDIGVGSGGWTSLFVLNELDKLDMLKKIELTVVDLSSEVLQSLKKQEKDGIPKNIINQFQIKRPDIIMSILTNSKKVCIPARKLPFQDAFFDLVYSGFTLHHMNLKDKVLSCTEMERVLRRQGVLGIVDEYLNYTQYLELLPTLGTAPIAQESFIAMEAMISFLDNIRIYGQSIQDKYYYFYGVKEINASCECKIR